jgi:mono/diheme cytochrome c family protein
MRKALKWIGIGLAVLLGLVLTAVIIINVIANSHLDKKYDVQAEMINIPTDAESIAKGKHIADTTCVGCHMPDFAGGRVMMGSPMGMVVSANLTPGKGGAGSEFTDAEWILAIRHGINPEGKAMAIMPFAGFYNLSDQDLGALIAYLKTVPPVDKTNPEPQFSTLAKALIATGQMKILDAEKIDHTGPRPTAPEPGVTTAYGKYLVDTHGCRDCHGPNLATPIVLFPSEPPPPNLTPAGGISKWKEAEFINALRTGTTPSGRTMSDFMPWKEFSPLTDDELKAIWVYLQSVPATQSPPSK